jgi:hypothetical protein
MALAVAYAQVTAPGPWRSRATPEAQGQVKEVDGKKIQVRYKEEPLTASNGVSQWRTYAYNDSRPEPPVQKVSMPKDVKEMRNWAESSSWIGPRGHALVVT